MPTASNVFIIKPGETYLVRPGAVVVRGDSFRIRNFLAREVTVTLPWRKGKKQTTLGAGDTKTLAVPAGVRPGAYEYRVEVARVAAKKRFARGNSAPIIIIDR